MPISVLTRRSTTFEKRAPAFYLITALLGECLLQVRVWLQLRSWTRVQWVALELGLTFHGGKKATLQAFAVFLSWVPHPSSTLASPLLADPYCRSGSFLGSYLGGPGSLPRLYAQPLEDTKIHRVPSPLGFSKNIGSQNSFRVHSSFFINETKNSRKEHQFSW